MGKLIVLEGTDSSGKSTQIELIKEYFQENNIRYTSLHFPLYEKTVAGKVISAYLRGEYGNIDEVDPIFVANIYAMDRFLYLPELKKYLEDFEVVLLDRYVFSNMAFQGAKFDTETQSSIMRDWINEFEFGFLELPYPDLNIFFDVPIDIIKNRLEKEREGDDRKYLEGKIDIHETNIDFQEKVRNNYLALRNYENFIVVPCVSCDPNDDFAPYTPEGVFKQYKEQLNRVLI